MLLIYSRDTGPRLLYTCELIFKEHLHIDFRVTADRNEIKDYTGAVLMYDKEALSHRFLNIVPHGLLSEKGIGGVDISNLSFPKDGSFFKDGRDENDILSSIFFLVSRYEEYLCKEVDEYGRFPHKCSVAFREGFLNLPLVNIWINELGDLLNEKFGLDVKRNKFSFLPTYDIDIAWSYLNKGFVRNIGGFLRSPGGERLRVLQNKEKDPFDNYDLLHSLHEKYDLSPIYFFLVASSSGKYDKNISPENISLRQLIKEHGDKYEIGLHPSWRSNFESLLFKEKRTLEDISGKQVSRSRQHYIKFTLPETYRRLIEAGITDDYSLGYGSHNGFRGSIASSFYWYDLVAETPTALRIHPFCFMDANAYFEQKLSSGEAYDELMHYYNICKNCNATCITIFHNNFFGEGEMKAWREMYQKFLENI